MKRCLCLSLFGRASASITDGVLALGGLVGSTDTALASKLDVKDLGLGILTLAAHFFTTKVHLGACPWNSPCLRHLCELIKVSKAHWGQSVSNILH